MDAGVFEGEVNNDDGYAWATAGTDYLKQKLNLNCNER